MARIAIIADDITGANDTGIQFRKKGMSSVVMLSERETGAGAIVADSDSRREPPQTAARQVKQAATLLKRQNPSFWYKKIDSTLRGNIGAELEALLAELEIPFAMMCPAFPATGRTVAGGVLFVKGVPVASTEFSKDVLTPVRSSSIERVIKQQADLACGSLGIQDLEQGIQHCKAKIDEQVAKGVKVVIADACSEKDLEHLGQIIAQYTNPPLVVGSAGLADFLPQEWYGHTNNHERNPVLVLAGSVSQTTREQVNILLQSGNCLEYHLDIAKVLNQDPRYRTMLVDMVFDSLAERNDVVIRSADSSDRVQEARNAGLELGLDSDRVSAMIAEFYATIAREITVREAALSGMVLTGGDIAIRICKSLEASGLELLDEVSAGIPVARIMGGVANGVRVVTKAGGFGKPNALVKAVTKLKENNRCLRK